MLAPPHAGRIGNSQSERYCVRLRWLSQLVLLHPLAESTASSFAPIPWHPSCTCAKSNSAAVSGETKGVNVRKVPGLRIASLTVFLLICGGDSRAGDGTAVSA